MGVAVGIDLGTTNSCVAVVDGGQAKVLPDREQQRVHPSIVSFLPDGEMLMGKAAKERRIIDPENTFYSTKRLLGRDFSTPEAKEIASRYPFSIIEGPNGIPVAVAHEKEYTLPEISSFILGHIKDIAAQALGEDVSNAVVTVPANFTDVQRSSTKISARIAGLKVLRILNEPTAAALAYGFGRGLTEKIAVYDYGGGTFDITILELRDEIFEVLSTAGDSYLGGDDLDFAIVDRMKEQFINENGFDLSDDFSAMQRLRSVAEQVKCQLSFLPKISARIRELTQDADGQAKDLVFELTREEFNSLAESQVQKTFAVCEDALKLSGRGTEGLDRVILVGGSTRVPLVRDMVRDYFSMEPLTEINPEEVVAIGAAIQAFTLSGEAKGTFIGMPQGQQPAQVKAPAVPTGGTVIGSGSPAAGTPASGGAAPPPVPQQEKMPPTGGQTKSGIPISDPGRATEPSSDTEEGVPPHMASGFRPPDFSHTRPPTLPGIEEDSWDLPESASSAPPPGGAPASTTGQTLDEMLPVPKKTGSDAQDLVEDRDKSPAKNRTVAYPGTTPTRPAPAEEAEPVDEEMIIEPVAATSEDHVHQDDPMAIEMNEETVGGLPPPPPVPQQDAVSSPPPVPPQAQAEDIVKEPPFTSAEPVAGAPSAPSDFSEPIPPPEQEDTQEMQLPESAPAPPPATDTAQPGGFGSLDIDDSLGGTTDFSAVPGMGTADPTQETMAVPPPAQASEASNAPADFALPPSEASIKTSMVGDQSMSSVAIPAAPRALLLDVTPRALGIGTAGGYCDLIIERNAAVPVEQTRIFTTSKDSQTEVTIPICQGESARLEENVVLGEINLEDIRPANRGVIKIQVTFEIDTDGILQVSAENDDTGEKQAVRVTPFGGLEDDKVEELVAEYAEKRK